MDKVFRNVRIVEVLGKLYFRSQIKKAEESKVTLATSGNRAF